MHPKLSLPLFLLLLLCLACTAPEMVESKEKPEENRFTKVVLTQG
ncbi:MAG: hypothetical protein ACI81W_003258, partial [Saprospiraceae bacterium]